MKEWKWIYVTWIYMKRIQEIKESTRRGVMLDLVLTNKEGLVGNVKL